VARALHDVGVVRGLALALMFAGCVIPPSLSVDTTDAGANSPPAITSVRADGVELPEFSTVVFEKDTTSESSLDLAVYDTDLADTLTCRAFVDYNNPDPTPPRAEDATAGRSVLRSCTLQVRGLCQTADLNQIRLLQLYVFDRQLLDTGELPLYQAMPATSHGLSTNRTYFLRCVEPQL
jgi:hypothetical protein